MKKKWLLFGGLILLAAVMAFLCQSTVRNVLIVPALYIGWVLRSFLLSINQLTYWHLLAAFLILVGLFSVIGGWGFIRRSRTKKYRQLGPIEAMARNIRSMPRGVYYKWLVAHQIGSLARAILVEQIDENNESTRTFVGRKGNPPEAVQKYLEASLERWGFFYPRRRFFLMPSTSPLDTDLDPVIDYLESQLEADE